MRNGPGKKRPGTNVRFSNQKPVVTTFEVGTDLRPTKKRKPPSGSSARRSKLDPENAYSFAIARAVSLAREVGESPEIRELCGGVYTTPPKVPSSAAPLAKGRPERWLVDTGGGHDLVDRDSVSSAILRTVRPAEHPLTLNTANGPTDVTKVVSLRVEALGAEVTPLLLACSPPVLSVG